SESGLVTQLAWHCAIDGLLPRDDFSAGFEGITISKEMPVGASWKKTETATGYTITYTSLGQESIAVPAGTFDAMKVRDDDGRGQYNSFTWYAAGVGLIKAVYETQGVTILRELISYSIPN